MTQQNYMPEGKKRAGGGGFKRAMAENELFEPTRRQIDVVHMK